MRFNAPFWCACQLVALLLVAVEVTSKSATGSRALVVLDAELPRHHFSQFFGSLEKELDLQLTFRQPKDEKPALTEYEENNFDHLLLLAPSAKSLSADLSPQALVSYLKAGGNILFGLSPNLAESYRDLAREFSIEFEPRGSRVVDHFSSLRGTENDTSLLLDSASTAAVADIASIFSSTRPGILQVPNAIAHRLGSNPLAFPLIRPATTSYSRDPSADASGAALAGSAEDAAIVSAFQLRESSSRAVWSGSVDIFSDASWKDGSRRSSRDGTIDTKQTINKEVALSIMSWLTQTTGVVKVAGTSHSRVRSGPEDLREDYEETIGEDGKEVQRMYRVKDHVTFNIDLVEYRSGEGWSPASRDLDLQVSLVMLDPFITTTLRALDAPRRSLSSRGKAGPPDRAASTPQSSAVMRSVARLVHRAFRRVESCAEWLTGAAGPLFVAICTVLVSIGAWTFFTTSFSSVIAPLPRPIHELLHTRNPIHFALGLGPAILQAPLDALRYLSASTACAYIMSSIVIHYILAVRVPPGSVTRGLGPGIPERRVGPGSTLWWLERRRRAARASRGGASAAGVDPVSGHEVRDDGLLYADDEQVDAAAEGEDLWAHCVGLGNERHFVLFMAWLALGMFVVVGSSWPVLKLSLSYQKKWPYQYTPRLFPLLTFALCAIMGFALAVMAGWQIAIIAWGETSVENSDNSHYREVAKQREERFVNVYDVGAWRNLQLFWNVGPGSRHGWLSVLAPWRIQPYSDGWHWAKRRGLLGRHAGIEKEEELTDDEVARDDAHPLATATR
ncbi:vacuole protein [Ceraceosorus bombacis]|uniref:Multifunctional fusion protein n=1 Tax=Ceraceosorus bombacis TaxID=401625 RepID=A0A0P1BA46_9BASI|nr:vacuole protein [Ceraceosorus bombacis]